MRNHYYYNDYENEYTIRKASENSYLPVNEKILDLIRLFKSSFRMSFLFSGVALDQFELYAPEMLDSYKNLLNTGCVGLLSGTYSNSFGPLPHYLLYDKQLVLQQERIRLLFGKEPTPFPGRHLQYSGNANLEISLVSDSRESNDVIYSGLSSKRHCDWPVTSEKLMKILNDEMSNNDIINIFIPYSISGVCQNLNTNLLEFLETFPSAVFSKSDYVFGNSSEITGHFYQDLSIDNAQVKNHKKNIKLFYPACNEMQLNAFDKLYSCSKKIEKCNDPGIIKDWLYLQSCDHFYFMNPLLYEESESCGVNIPYDSPYFAYINYMNILMDFSYRLKKWSDDNNEDQKDLYCKTEKISKDKLNSTALRRVKKLSMGKCDK